nr:MAG: hypothetical protein [Bacteriophage sp.]
MTETDSGITESYNEMGKGVGTRDYDSITRDYNAGTRDYDSTRGYDSITRGYRREREGVGTIGLD